ncbi:hypothetical protein M231_07402 [Tremella mesenterica]|uniref:Uncharacterized protein n=1 Tax=Tremella mesenterica TaxID=5217 RepID=A0A4V1M319_TREME|nr:hypothetical protein M231_07402 [Tremella mesenterica]
MSSFSYRSSNRGSVSLVNLSHLIAVVASPHDQPLLAVCPAPARARDFYLPHQPIPGLFPGQTVVSTDWLSMFVLNDSLVDIFHGWVSPLDSFPPSDPSGRSLARSDPRQHPRSPISADGRRPSMTTRPDRNGTPNVASSMIKRQRPDCKWNSSTESFWRTHRLLLEPFLPPSLQKAVGRARRRYDPMSGKRSGLVKPPPPTPILSSPSDPSPLVAHLDQLPSDGPWSTFPSTPTTSTSVPCPTISYTHLRLPVYPIELLPPPLHPWNVRQLPFFQPVVASNTELKERNRLSELLVAFSKINTKTDSSEEKDDGRQGKGLFRMNMFRPDLEIGFKQSMEIEYHAHVPPYVYKW